MKELRRYIRGCWYFLWGNLFALFSYDRKYLRGRWFAGRAGGVCATGWEWVTHDAIGRFFSLYNREARFPINQSCRVISPENLEFDPDDLNNFQSFGIYYQALGRIRIGKVKFHVLIGIPGNSCRCQSETRRLERHEAVADGQQFALG